MPRVWTVHDLPNNWYRYFRLKDGRIVLLQPDGHRIRIGDTTYDWQAAAQYLTNHDARPTHAPTDEEVTP